MAVDVDQVERELVERLRSVYGGRRWIVAGEVVQGIAPGAVAVRSLGATDVLLIASDDGVGDVPDDLRIIMSDGGQVGDDASMVERMHDNNRDLHDLPSWVIDEVNEWDPEHTANVIASFTIDAGLIAERPTFGARHPAWAALEDKIAIRAVWEQAGIATAPDRVVALDDVEGLLRAHDELSTRFGSVWAVDNDQGWHGGAKGTHWVPDRDRALELASSLRERHRHVRVQPFLEGVPCSIHGMVLADYTMAFRPCEMIMLLDWQKHTLEYARAATFWDPPPDRRREMRETARAIGDTLRVLVDYRGVFTVDGVLTADGFRPTEVNPRFGAALPPRLPTADGGEFRLFLVHLAAVEGHLDDFDPLGVQPMASARSPGTAEPKEPGDEVVAYPRGSLALETLIIERLDKNRAGSAFVPVSVGPQARGHDGDQTVDIAGTVHHGQVSELRAAEPDEQPLMTAVWGSEPSGGLIFLRFTDAMPVGPPVAPTVVAARAFLARYWGLEMTQLEAIAARSVKPT